MEFHSFVAAAAAATVVAQRRRDSFFSSTEEGTEERRKGGQGTRESSAGRVRRRAHNAAIYWPKFAMPRFTWRRDIAHDAIAETRRAWTGIAFGKLHLLAWET